MRILFAGTIRQYAANKIGQREAKKKVQERLAEAKSYFNGSTDKLSNGQPSPMSGLEAMKPDPIQQRLAAIAAKMKAGRRLSPTDLSFLEEHNPAMYDKAMKIEEDRQNYKDSLRGCRTKQDVAKAKAACLSNMAADFQAGDTSSIDNVETFHMRVNAINDEHDRFVRSKRYMELPDSDEDAKKKNKRKDDDGEVGEADGEDMLGESYAQSMGENKPMEDILMEMYEKKE